MKIPRIVTTIEFWIVAVIVALFVIARFTDPPKPKAAPVVKRTQRASEESETLLILNAERSIRRSLKDPDSASFGRSYVSHRNGIKAVCGTVNARNSFGGMSGQQRFISNRNITALEEQVEDGGFEDVWRRVC